MLTKQGKIRTWDTTAHTVATPEHNHLFFKCNSAQRSRCKLVFITDYYSSFTQENKLTKTLKFKTYFITWKSNATHTSLWNYHVRVKALDLTDQELSIPVWWVPTALIPNHKETMQIFQCQRFNIYYIVSALRFRSLMKILTCNIQNINVLMTTWKCL